MPELPDLLHIQSKLSESLLSWHVASERVREPVVLRFAVRGNLSLLLGRPLRAVLRKSHFLVFRFEGLDLAVNPMLAGRFRVCEPPAKDEASLAFALGFSPDHTPEGKPPERELRYLDDKKMGKAYLIANDDWKAIPGMQTGGVDILGPEFTRERFVSLLKHRRDQVRVFLLDKKALDSLGNAYADEVLFEAGLHPKTFCRSLSHDEGVKLHDAIVKVVSEAVAEVAARGEGTDVKVRDFLKVRLKETCPRCSGRIRKAGVRGMDAYFCPHCQPARRPGFVDWTKTGR
jgi:formamidopyrimidine-DNA glycosylase